MNKTIQVVVHTSYDDMHMAMMSAKTDSRMARQEAVEAKQQRDAAFMMLSEERKKVALEKEQRSRRNKLIAKLGILGACSVGCALSAVFCIRNGLWWTTIAPILTVVYATLDLCNDLR